MDKCYYKVHIDFKYIYHTQSIFDGKLFIGLIVKSILIINFKNNKITN